MSTDLRSSLHARDRVELGPIHRDQVLVAERRLVEIDGEVLPLRLLTIETDRPRGERSAGLRSRPNPTAPRRKP